MKVEFSQQIFKKYSSIKFCENLSSESWMDMLKAVVASHNFVNAPKKIFRTIILFVVLYWRKTVFHIEGGT
jgi:hypothetical protein